MRKDKSHEIFKNFDKDLFRAENTCTEKITLSPQQRIVGFRAFVKQPDFLEPKKTREEGKWFFAKKNIDYWQGELQNFQLVIADKPLDCPQQDLRPGQATDPRIDS